MKDLCKFGELELISRNGHLLGWTPYHNISGVILPSQRYKQIYKKGAYVIPPVIALYNETIDKDATRLEINCAKGNHEARINDRHLYQTANNACQ